MFWNIDSKTWKRWVKQVELVTLIGLEKFNLDPGNHLYFVVSVLAIGCASNRQCHLTLINHGVFNLLFCNLVPFDIGVYITASGFDMIVLKDYCSSSLKASSVLAD